MSIPHPVIFTESDIQQRLYTVSSSGELTQFDQQGEVLANFGTIPFGNLTELQIKGLRIFLFFENTQQYIFLDRFLTHRGEIFEIPESVGYARLATLSSDNQIWLIDDRNLNLVKFNLEYQQVSIQTSLGKILDDATLDPYQLEEYQNRLYVGDRKLGILVLDNLGNYLKTLTISGEVALRFTGEQMYYLHEGKLHYHHLYKDLVSTDTFPQGVSYSQAVILGNHLWMIKPKSMDLYYHNP